MNKLKYIFAGFVALTMISCSEKSELSVSDGNQELNRARIYGTSAGAVKGELVVKLTEKGLADIEGAIKGIPTKSGTEKTIKRVFPESSIRKDLSYDNGLDRWCVVKFDSSEDLDAIAKALSENENVEKIEFSQTLKPVYDPKRSSIALTKSTLDEVGNISKDNRYNDPYASLQWDLVNNGQQDIVTPSLAGSDVNAKRAWSYCEGDPSIIVAILDEGVMYSHPDLADNMWVNEGEVALAGKDADGNGYKDDVHGYNFVSDNGSINWNKSSDTGHGTHVAGVVAAKNNNGIGIGSLAGGTTKDNGVRIMSCQIFSGDYSITNYNEARAIKYAADNGAVVLQCSWGVNSGYATYPNSAGYTNDDDWSKGSALEKEALEYFVHNAGSPDGVIDGGIAVFAAGNESSGMVGYPGCYKDFLSVGAIAADYTPAIYSNYGVGVDVFAPGGDMDYHQKNEGCILSTIIPSQGSSQLDTPANEKYGFMEGTSMACPHVSSIVALGLSYAQKLHKHYRWEDFLELVRSSTHTMNPYLSGDKFFYTYFAEYGTSSPSTVNLQKFSGKTGKGYIDADLLMLAVADGGTPMRIPNVRVGVGTTSQKDLSPIFEGGASKTYSATVADTGIATVSFSGSVMKVTGVKNGSTTAHITASGVDQSISIIVREGDTGSWL